MKSFQSLLIALLLITYGCSVDSGTPVKEWSKNEIVGYTYELKSYKYYERLSFSKNGMVAVSAGQRSGPIITPLWSWKINNNGVLNISDNDGKERIVLNLVEIKNNKATVISNNKTLVYERSKD